MVPSTSKFQRNAEHQRSVLEEIERHGEPDQFSTGIGRRKTRISSGLTREAEGEATVASPSVIQPLNKPPSNFIVRDLWQDVPEREVCLILRALAICRDSGREGPGVPTRVK